MNRNKQLASFAILSILILACQVSGISATPTPPAPTSTSTPEATPTNTSTPTPTAFVAEMGKAYIAKAGGFSVSSIEGYNEQTNSYQAFFGNDDESVTVFVQGDPKPDGKTPKAVLKSYTEFFAEAVNDYSQGEMEEIVIDSEEGMAQDYYGTVDEEPLHGKLVVIFPKDSKAVTLVVRSIGEGKWESEGELVYKAIIENLSFFKPEIATTCPIATNRGYGYDKDSPIKIGGGTSDGMDREEEYLSALLGPHGEIISYYRNGSIEVDGVILDEYSIGYKNTFYVIYLDVYNYDSPAIPFGFNCSTAKPLLSN